MQQTAGSAVHRFGGLSGAPELSPEAIAAGAWWWAKVFVRFVHHDFIIRDRLGRMGDLQGLISPEVLVRMERPEGDCAIFSECIAAFLRVFGVGYEWVTVAVNPREPEIFSHVYLYGIMPDGTRLPLDASHGQYPGWQVPSSHVSRRQVWDADGNPVADRGSRFDGLHGFYGLRGLGDDAADLAAYDAAMTALDEANTTYGTSTGGADQGPPNIYEYDLSASDYGYGSSKVTAPSKSSTDWAAFATAMGKAGFTLAQINAIQPGTVVGANGQISRQTAGYAIPGTTLTSALGGSNSTMIIALAGLAAVLLMMGRK